MKRTLAEIADDFLSYAIAVQTTGLTVHKNCDTQKMIYEWPHLRVTDHLPSTKTQDELVDYVLEHEATKTAIKNLALSTVERMHAALSELIGLVAMLNKRFRV